MIKMKKTKTKNKTKMKTKKEILKMSKEELSNYKWKKKLKGGKK